MADEYGERIPYWGRELQRRIENIERLKPEVIADNVKTLSEDVNALRRAFYTFAISTVGAAIIFAFSVFALLGRHP